jgi:DnaJ family protein C protein 8
MNLANEGLEARRKEEESATKKRKAEDDARWEGTSFKHFSRLRRLNSSAQWQKTESNVWEAGGHSTLERRRKSPRLM